MKKNTGISFVLFLVITLPCIVHSQNIKLDSLTTVLQGLKEDTSKVNTLYFISWEHFIHGNYTEALEYADEELSMAKRLNFKKGIAGGFWLNAVAYLNQSNYPEAIVNALKSLEIKKVLNDKRGAVSAYQLISSAYGMLGNYSESLKYSYEALKIHEELKDTQGIAHQLADLANTYLNNENYSEGKKNALEAYKFGLKAGDPEGLIWSRGILSRIDIKEGKLKDALDKRLLNIKIVEKMDSADADFYLADEYQYAGKIFEKLGDEAFNSGNKVAANEYFTEAERYYLLSLKVNERNNYENFIASVHVDLSNIAIKLKRFSQAKEHLQQSLELSKAIGFKDVIRDSYKSLSILDSLKGNYKEALNYYRLYILYRDSILNNESIGKSSEIRMQYAIEKAEAENKIMQAKKDAEAKLVRNLQYTAIIIFFIVGIFLYWNNYQKQKAKKRIEKAYAELKSTQAQLIQSEKMASLGELTAGIAHEIQNPLNFVNNFSEVSNELLDEMKEELATGNLQLATEIAEDIRQNLEKINHHGKRADAIVKGMLQHSRAGSGQEEPTDINALCDEYLRLAYHGLRAKDKSFNADFKTDFDAGIGKVNVVPQDIGRVLLNLFNNAFYAVNDKFTANRSPLTADYKPTVSVQTKKVNGKVEISVSDNGSGIPLNIVDKIFQPFFTTKPTGQGTGLGLSLAYDIIKAHGGEIKVQTKEDEGAKLVIVLPV